MKCLNFSVKILRQFKSWVNGGSSITKNKILRGRAVVARKAHNLEVGGSIPPPATNGDAATSYVSMYSLFEEKALTSPQMKMLY